MKKITYIITASLLLLMLVVAFSCQKKYDPPIYTPTPGGTVITLDSLINMYQGAPIKFTDSISVYANVTMDETDGNIYKSVYIQANNKAINLRMLASGGLFVGDSIRIDMPGVILNQYNGIMQLDSVNVDKYITKMDVNKKIPPLVTTIDQLNPNLQSRLIKLENVQFIKQDLNSTYADGDNLVSYDLILEDANFNTVVVRTSGYSNFADELVAQGNGSIVCIVGIFNNSVQLIIRSFAEINMNGARNPGILVLKDFNDNLITSNGWTSYQVTGTNVKWETSTAGGAPSPYAVIKNYIGGTNYACENWLISPKIDLSGSTTSYLNFKNAYNYAGPALELYISTDYDGTSNPTTQGTWNGLPANWSTGGFTWADSGNINISAYISNNVYIAFKYTGTASNGSTWELDNIRITG